MESLAALLPVVTQLPYFRGAWKPTSFLSYMPIITVSTTAYRKSQMKVYIYPQIASHSAPTVWRSLPSLGRPSGVEGCAWAPIVESNAPVASACWYSRDFFSSDCLPESRQQAKQHLSVGISVHQTLCQANFHCLFFPVQNPSLES